MNHDAIFVLRCEHFTLIWKSRNSVGVYEKKAIQYQHFDYWKNSRETNFFESFQKISKRQYTNYCYFLNLRAKVFSISIKRYSILTKENFQFFFIFSCFCYIRMKSSIYAKKTNSDLIPCPRCDSTKMVAEKSPMPPFRKWTVTWEMNKQIRTFGN